MIKNISIVTDLS